MPPRYLKAEYQLMYSMTILILFLKLYVCVYICKYTYIGKDKEKVNQNVDRSYFWAVGL